MPTGFFNLPGKGRDAMGSFDNGQRTPVKRNALGKNVQTDDPLPAPPQDLIKAR